MRAAMTYAHFDDRHQELVGAVPVYQTRWAAPVVAMAVGGGTILFSYVVIAGTVVLLSALFSSFVG
jgi:hypothetical protein